MIEDSLGKRVVVVFLVCVAAYFALYFGDRHLRIRKGPWKLVFSAEQNGTPVLEVSQPSLGVSSWKLRFPGERVPDGFTNSLVVLADAPMKKVPFGVWFFDDLMYLPGTVVLNVFDHGIQLLPKAAAIDGRVINWQPELSLDLSPTNKVPFEPLKKKKKS